MATAAMTAAAPVAASPGLAPPQAASPCAETERLEAAHALLGVSPASSDAAPSSCSSLSAVLSGTQPQQQQQPQHNDATRAASSSSPSPAAAAPAIGRPRSGSYDASLVSLAGNKSQSSGGALDALAALAAGAAVPEAAAPAVRDDAAAAAARSIMPPPPPRSLGLGGRLRSASNPEGMEKWDSLGGSGRGRAADTTNRRHFVLPSSILEEELADANAACAESGADAVMSDAHSSAGAPPRPSSAGSGPRPPRGLPLKKRMQKLQHLHNAMDATDSFGTSPNSVMMAIEEEPCEEEELEAERAASPPSSHGAVDPAPPPPPPPVPDEDESDLEPAELLRRARARLLEDLSTEGAMGEKGVLPLPHSLAKYKEVYNKNGRIGIYTPAERAAIIAKFNSKRSRRVWNKKIRYNCRKNLADRRMRVKGRFVKRSTEQAAQLKAQLEQQAEEAAKPPLSGGEGGTGAGAAAPGGGGAAGGAAPGAGTDDHTSPSSSSSSSRASSPNPAEPPAEGAPPPGGEEEAKDDEEMPDVDDPEAGFKPKSGQPYRRTRRHTIT